MTTLVLLQNLDGKLVRLHDALEAKSKEFDHVLKMGRTQLEDAIPVRLGQEFGAYASAVQRGLERIRKTESELHVVNMGATAIRYRAERRSEVFRQHCPHAGQGHRH
jgi:aspartate ammonia-lyase